MNYPMHTPPKAKKKPNTLLIVVLVLFTVTAACICGVAVATSSGEKKPTAPATTAAATGCEHGTLPSGQCAEAGTPQSTVIVGTIQPTAVAPPVSKAPAVPTIEEGLYTVGEDIPAGTYKTTGSPSTCYWAIYKAGQNQSFDSIVTNHLGGGNQRVTLKAGQEFESKRCGTWTKV